MRKNLSFNLCPFFAFIGLIITFSNLAFAGMPNLDSFCVDKIKGNNVNATNGLYMINGDLCAINPNETGDQNSNYGFHSIGVPHNYYDGNGNVRTSGSYAIRGVWVHLGGSAGKPYDPNGSNPEKFKSQLFMDEIMQRRYLVIKLAYPNAAEETTAYLCPENQGGNDCAGKVRREKLTGINYSNKINIGSAQSIERRLDKLMDYLVSNNFIKMPLGSYVNGSPVYPEIIFSGHSEGASQAAYIAKHRAGGVKASCYIAGAFDPPDSSNSDAADWIESSVQESNIWKQGALRVGNDDKNTFWELGHDLLGVAPQREAPSLVYHDKWGNEIKINGAYSDGHLAAMGAKNLDYYREKACFSDGAGIE